MHKAKLTLPDKARRVFPDSLGSLVIGFDDQLEVSGKELEILEPNVCESAEEEEPYVQKIEEKLQKPQRDGPAFVSLKEVLAADEKRSDLEHEVSFLFSDLISSMFTHIFVLFWCSVVAEGDQFRETTKNR